MKGTVRVGGVAVYEITPWEFDERRPEDETASTASDQTALVYGQGHPIYYANVIDVLKGNAEPAIDVQEVLRSLALPCATYEFAR